MTEEERKARQRAYSKRWYAANRARRRAYLRDWERKHYAQLRQYDRERYCRIKAENPEFFREYMQQWAARNPDRIKEYAKRRNTRITAAVEFLRTHDLLPAGNWEDIRRVAIAYVRQAGLLPPKPPAEQ